jgi:hypothetical protein
MLDFEPIENRSAIPEGIAEVVLALEKRGFLGSYQDELALINLGRRPPLIEHAGKFYYGDVMVGYLRFHPQEKV